MKKLVIFDLDGTLLDTIADLAAATNQALRGLGFAEHPVSAYYMFVGNGVYKLFERALPEGEKTQENILAVKSLFVPYYDAHKADLSRPYPGIKDMLAALNRKNVKIAVASNKYDSATKDIVSHYFPEIEFSAVIGQREGIPVKPDSRIVDDILSIAGVGKSETLYVGDSGVDMQTAHNAGVESCGVSWGFRGRGELEQYSPHYIVDTAEGILSLV